MRALLPVSLLVNLAIKLFLPQNQCHIIGSYAHQAVNLCLITKTLGMWVSWTKKSFLGEFHICKIGRWDLSSENCDLISVVKELFFFMWTIFKVFMNLLQYCFCFMFWFFGLEACGILAPTPGMEPTPPALEGEVFTTGPPGKTQNVFIWAYLSW